jgi:hypothetical protein
MCLGSRIRDPRSRIRKKTYSGSRIQWSNRHRIPDPDPQNKSEYHLIDSMRSSTGVDCFLGPAHSFLSPACNRAILCQISAPLFCARIFLSPLKGHYHEIIDFKFFKETSLPLRQRCNSIRPFLFYKNFAKIFSQLKVHHSSQQHQRSHLSRDHNNRSDTGGKFAIGVNNVAVKLPPGSTMSVVNLPSVSITSAVNLPLGSTMPVVNFPFLTKSLSISVKLLPQ